MRQAVNTVVHATEVSPYSQAILNTKIHKLQLQLQLLITNVNPPQLPIRTTSASF